jgi:small subunit ribosomal protein S2
MEETKNDIKSTEANIDLMQKAGLFFGHKASSVHPKMKPFISGVKNDINVINLEMTAVELKKALDFVEKIISSGKTLLLVGTKIQSKKFVKETAQEIGLPFITERWLGGTFTNFETMKKRLSYFKELERKKAAGELEKYTKKERAGLDKELKDLETKFGGIKNMEKLPDAIFAFDMRKDSLAIKEAKAKKVKVIAIADTNVDPSLADFAIPANDDASNSVKYILECLKEAVLKAKPKAEIKE